MDAEIEAVSPPDFSTLMPANEALAILEMILGGSFYAKQELADRMRDGRLAVYARRAWDSRERAVATAWNESIDDDDESYDLETDFEVSARVWRESLRWSLDQSDWRWPSGRFSTVVRQSPFLRYMIQGVHFARSEIDVLRAALDSGATLSAASPTEEEEDRGGKRKVAGNANKRIGRRHRGHAWANALFEVIRLKDRGQLTKACYPLLADLTRHLVTVAKCEDPELEQKELLMEDAITPFASKIYNEFVKSESVERIP